MTMKVDVNQRKIAVEDKIDERHDQEFKSGSRD